MDSEVQATEEFSEADLLMRLTHDHNDDSDEDDNGEVTEEPVPATKEALKSIETLRKYFGSIELTEKPEFNSLNLLQTKLISNVVEKQKQK